jgi:hypothetical protein
MKFFGISKRGENFGRVVLSRLPKGMAFISFSIPLHSKTKGKFGDRDGKSPKGWLFWKPGSKGLFKN